MAALRAQLSDLEVENLAAEGATWTEDRAVSIAEKMTQPRVEDWGRSTEEVV